MTSTECYVCFRDKRHPHWACRRCAPYNRCNEHGTGVVAAHTMWFKLFGHEAVVRCPLGCFGGDGPHTLSECPRGKFRLSMLHNRSFTNLAGLRMFCLQPTVVNYGIAADQDAAVVATLARKPMTLKLLLLWTCTADATLRMDVTVSLPQCPSISALCNITLSNSCGVHVAFAPGTDDNTAGIVRRAWAFCHVAVGLASVNGAENAHTR